MAVETELDLANLLPATLTAPGLTEDEFLALRDKFPDATLEYAADGTVIIMPPTDPENGSKVFQVCLQLGVWAEKQCRGIVTGPDAGFHFRDGSRRSPDAVWYDAARWREAKKSGKRFPVFAPDFVIEVRSPDQRVRTLREKMEEYIANGVVLGWLIDPLDRTVAIYRQGRAPEFLSNPSTVAGEGPVDGFVLNLGRVFS
jgi:Uma2 family endonuclease